MKKRKPETGRRKKGFEIYFTGKGQTDKQTDTQTDGHCDSMTDLVQRAESVNILIPTGSSLYQYVFMIHV